MISAALLGSTRREARELEQLIHGDSSYAVTLLPMRSLDEVTKKVEKGEIDVILLDLQGVYPSSGTFKQLYEQSCGVPIIVLTDDDDENLALSAVQAGAQDFLIKGEIDKNALLRSIRYSIERSRLAAQLEVSRRLERHLAQHDFLTGLPNRLLFLDRLQQALRHASRMEKRIAVLFLDLDSFKRINDTLGHGTGDQLLKGVARRLCDTIRESDTVARMGGDEFTIILFDTKDSYDAAKIAKKILDVISAPFFIDGHELFVTASIGISMYPGDGIDADSIIKRADIAMYRAKGCGKNNFKLYKLSMDATFFEHLTLENSLRRAITNNELVTHFQPQICLKTGAVSGFEALVRWQHPQHGLVSPAKFIPLAEETGMITSIDEWVLRSACQHACRWEEFGGKNLEIAVNLSARQFRRKSLPDVISGVLAETGLPPQCLCIEITESNVMQNVEHTISVLGKLKEIGVKLSVDDFGKGYSSLNYLKRFPIDTLKVDRSFVSGIPIDRDDMAISTAIVVLAQSMDLGVVAEGVETAEQLAFFRSLRCDSMQGYYFSPPVPHERVEELLRSSTVLAFPKPVEIV